MQSHTLMEHLIINYFKIEKGLCFVLYLLIFCLLRFESLLETNYHTPFIITRSWLETTLEYLPYIRTEFSEKSSLKRFWPSKSGFKTYKPQIIAKRVRYTILKDRIELQWFGIFFIYFYLIIKEYLIVFSKKLFLLPNVTVTFVSFGHPKLRFNIHCKYIYVQNYRG